MTDEEYDSNYCNEIDFYVDRMDPRKAYTVALVLSLGNMVDAISIMNVGFILAEMHNLTREKKEMLSSAIFIGMLSGGLVCGYFADRIGRKPCLLASLTVNFIASVLTSLSPTPYWLMAFLLFAGLGIGGSVPIVFSLGAELFPSAIRGRLISLVASFWMVGAIFSSVCGWIMLGYGKFSLTAKFKLF
jgi:VNT family MFS transporter (synaptic vesicle glycoprotein 2)